MNSREAGWESGRQSRASSTEDTAQGASRISRLRNHNAITLTKRRKIPAGLGKNKILLGEVGSNSAMLQMDQEGSGASGVYRAKAVGWELLRSLLGKL